MENLTFEKITLVVGVILILLGAYNTFFSARNNYRSETKRRAEPTATLAAKVAAHQEMLDNDKRMLERLDKELTDTKDGQKYMVRGIQALLEHELHNGNADQMEQASQELSKWLTNKI